MTILVHWNKPVRLKNQILKSFFYPKSIHLVDHWISLQMHATQRAKIAEKVHKPPLAINIINFELKGFNAFIWVPWSPSDIKKLKCIDRTI